MCRRGLSNGRVWYGLPGRVCSGVTRRSFEGGRRRARAERGTSLCAAACESARLSASPSFPPVHAVCASEASRAATPLEYARWMGEMEMGGERTMYYSTGHPPKIDCFPDPRQNKERKGAFLEKNQRKAGAFLKIKENGIELQYF